MIKSDFLIKHYEKIMLLVALGGFAISLIWLIDVFYFVSNAKSSGIVLSADRAAYKPLDKKIYSSKTNLEESKLLLDATKRNTSPNDPNYILPFTDFMYPFEIARSNAPSAGNKLIPYIYYKHGIDPITKEKISLAEKTVTNTDSFDTDKDGIPDSIEKKYNLNPKNPQDIYNDVDNDGFSNIQEYRYNKNGIADKKIHPPLIDRLALIKVSNTIIPLILKKVIKRGADKKNWDIQINLKSANRGWTTKFLKIGDSIEINDMKYTITDIESKTDNVLDPRLGVIVENDVSSIALRNSMNEKISALKNEQISEPNRLITLKNLYTGKILTGKIGDTITLGNNNVGQEKYKIVNIRNNSNSIEFEKKGKIYVVERKSNYKLPIKSTILLNKPPPIKKK